MPSTIMPDNMTSEARNFRSGKACGRLLTVLFLSFALLPAQQTRQMRQEEREDYFKRWLEQDVKYIIVDEEKKVFSSLTTIEEKEAFIEQFWFRRDPNPQTSFNEFKEEHYRRIAYTNEHFRSGKPGWMTDRGRVYIIHGEPEYIERYPSGGPYARKPHEGGASTYTYPFEIWHYRELQGVGQDISLEFVDPSFSGEYRLALRPEEKDMLLYVSGTAPTIRELLGRESGRVDRPYFNPGLENNAFWRAQHSYSERDTPFARYARFAAVQRPTQIKFADLREVVTTNITYHNFPHQIRSDFIRLNETQVLCPITIEVENQELTFDYKNGIYVAKANIYGVVRGMVGRIEAEFEDSVVAEYKPEFLEQGRKIKSVYQKIVVLEGGKKYRVDVVVRDENSNRVGASRAALDVPPYKDPDSLGTSSLILSKWIEPAPPETGIDERFILGNIRIIPNVDNTFQPGEWLGAYLQVYNVELDQAQMKPQLRVRYVIRKGDQVLHEFLDNARNTVHYFSSQRLVLIRQIQLKDLEEGSYQLEIEVEDLVGHRKVATRSDFQVITG